MTAKRLKAELDKNTEEKIKQAARLVFHRKGYAATRTRDISNESGINLAMLNYYFRSKEKLFDIIMMETLQTFLTSITVAFNNEHTSFETKVEFVAASYIDLLNEEPDIPLFIMSELRNHPNDLLKRIDVKNIILNSAFARQYREKISRQEIAPLDMLHFVMNLMGLTVFPFVASPMLKIIGDLKDDKYQAMMNERKALIPKWISAILQVK